MPRPTALLAVKAATLFGLCAGLPVSAASADAGPGGGTPHRGAESSPGSTSVQLRVLPLTRTPTSSPTTSPTANPAETADKGGSAVGHSTSDNDISADIDSGHWNGSGTSSHHGHAGSYGHGAPHGHLRDGKAGFAGPGSHNGSHRPTRHGAPLHGLLPFTGRGMTAALLTGTGTVFTGTVLVWLASLRRRRATPRT